MKPPPTLPTPEARLAALEAAVAELRKTTWPAELSCREAARYLGVSVTTIDVAIRRGELRPVYPLGRTRGGRLVRAELDAYVRELQARRDAGWARLLASVGD